MHVKRTVVALAAAGLALTAAPALASGLSYTVAVGGSTATGTHAFTASAGTISFQVKNNTGTTINMSCASVSASGVARSGSGITDIADIASSTWNTCKGPGGALNVTQTGTWVINGDSTAVTSAATDVIGGHVHQIKAHVASPTGICTFDVAGNIGGTTLGRANGSFNEATQKLSVAETGFTGNLVVYNVAGCLGQIQNGNKADFTGDFAVSVADGPINGISSP
jgi:hypothetical protein